MATLIAVYNGERCVGRCDAKCYNAKHTKCTCVCGGRNHGVGLKEAVDNTQDMAKELLERYAEDNKKVEIQALQMQLL